ncbi:MAG: acetate--CoA ligase family protein [Rhizomicrobium sp.]
MYEADPHTALFHTTERCFQALAGWQWRERRLNEAGYVIRTASANTQAESARATLRNAAKKITEREGKDILSAYGVPVARDVVVQNADDAVRAAKDVGFPIVLKVESPDIAHKTEAGVVRLNIGNEDEVSRGIRRCRAGCGESGAQTGDPRRSRPNR